MKTTYEQQAIDFMQACGITFEARFVSFGPYFEGEKESRDKYAIVFKKPEQRNKSLSLTFGQSTAHSYRIQLKDLQHSKRVNDIRSWSTFVDNPNGQKPTAYDVLCCIVKSDPGNFEEFCSEYGYDEDSRKAYSTWQLCVEQWHDVKHFFTQSEIEQLQEIN
ncbi:MAG TPA: hypothetical protein VL443_24045 [Cyclobacteriaceae bacterium]|jgi:hypothetical protein|nr:hypothetical protein [Cyclobacteriaceae bacterium]